ncbi:hypothetical protein [Flavobacterium sp.]|uniref:hypothetical protein n=1 Tax=Flavobacterium sp. TaxID=239 RepID=UPI003341F90D
MSTIELKQELHDIINNGDDKFVQLFHDMATSYFVQIKKDKMIAESEKDIESGNIYAQEEVKKMIANWKE